MVDPLTFIQNELTHILEQYLLEPNDDTTRGDIRTEIESFLQPLQTSRTIVYFRVECDEYNNPPDLVDTCRLHVDVWVKEYRSSEKVHIWCEFGAGGVSTNIVNPPNDYNKRYDRAMGIL